MTKEQIEQNQPKIIHPYPNTYTYTKYLTECWLQANRGNMPLTILRPSIVGAAQKDPYPGWIDSVSASAAIYLTTGYL